MTSHRQQTNINLYPLLEGLEQPLQLMSEGEARDRARAYIDAARPQVERAAFDLLANVVGIFNEASAYQRAILEYADGGLRLRVDETQENEVEASFSDSDPERVTIRLPKELKTLIDLAATRHGISANNWYVRALSRAVARQFRHERFGEQAAEGDAVGRTEPGEGRRGRHRRGFYRGRGGRGIGGEGAGQGD